MPDKPLNIVCIGAHPDDAETACGGTLARFADEGHRVTILYLTRGEASRRRVRYENIAEVRTSEALCGCGTLNALAEFADQNDGMTSTDEAASRRFAELLARLKPDIVFTHWPLDAHSDHRNASELAHQAWESAQRTFTLVYYEIMTGVQSQHFHPNWFVDISNTSKRKRDAIYAHVSQDPDRFYPHHDALEQQRGAEASCERAEAFFVMGEKLPASLNEVFRAEADRNAN